MAYELREGELSLFPNDKGDNPNRPDYKGSCNIGGVIFDVAVWNKESQAGKKYMSGKITIKENKEAENE